MKTVVLIIFLRISVFGGFISDLLAEQLHKLKNCKNIVSPDSDSIPKICYEISRRGQSLRFQSAESLRRSKRRAQIAFFLPQQAINELICKKQPCQKIELKISVKVNIIYHCVKNHLTLTRPIGLPPRAPVAQKIADQR